MDACHDVARVRGPSKIVISFWPRDDWFLPLSGGEENSYVSWASLRGLRCAYALTDRQRLLLLARVPTRAPLLRPVLPAGMRRMQYLLFPAAADTELREGIIPLGDYHQ
jgi:hypothetical protein